MRDQDPPQPLRGVHPETGERHHLADILRQHREDILSAWEHALHTRRPDHPLGGPLLRDHIPEFVDQLADAAEHPPRDVPAQVPRAITDEHALERLEQGFEPGELALEYGLLRHSILQRLEREGYTPSFAELELLDETIDQGIMRAVTSYARVRERMLRALEQVSRAALDSEDVDTFLPKLLQVLMEAAVAVDAASILLREGDKLHVRAAVGLGAKEGLADDFTIPIGEGISGRVAAERRPISLRSVSTDPRLAYSVIRELGIRASYSIPLLHRDNLVGVAHMSSRTVFDFSESDKLLFRAMMTRATSFIVQAELAARERAARAEAERSLAQLDTLLEASPVGVAFLDRELRYLRINETLAALNEHPMAFHQGKTFREVVPGWVADEFEAVFRRVLDTGEPVTGHEFISRTREGTGPERHWLGNYYPVRTASGEVMGLGCVVVDITAQKEVEAELRRSGELREQLIGVVGHDLRNPLNAITASAFLMERTEELSGGGHRAVERIRNSAGRMARMLGDLLDFARSNHLGGLPMHRERVNLHDITRSALEELQVAYVDRKLELELEGDGWGWWDADRLAQVVGNLVSNALHHGRPDAPVRVKVHGIGPEVLLSIHNEGAPIPPELQARLFQPFRRGTTGKAGTRSVGLGLYIVRQVAHAHGGDVTVHSTEGAGTTFTVRLPRGSPEAP
ncbi:MAG TPA: ATP-binding protein [Archangium sp.]|jgi:PAS domain S-box-containing protein|uniref:ATP-binding protein n=1 Tax=Archangium sp. TaxID=1872627 RepID=UPI002ED8CD4E